METGFGSLYLLSPHQVDPIFHTPVISEAILNRREMNPQAKACVGQRNEAQKR